MVLPLYDAEHDQAVLPFPEKTALPFHRPSRGLFVSVINIKIFFLPAHLPVLPDPYNYVLHYNPFRVFVKAAFHPPDTIHPKLEEAAPKKSFACALLS